MLPFLLDGRMSLRRVDTLEADGMGVKKGEFITELDKPYTASHCLVASDLWKYFRCFVAKENLKRVLNQEYRKFDDSSAIGYHSRNRLRNALLCRSAAWKRSQESRALTT